MKEILRGSVHSSKDNAAAYIKLKFNRYLIDGSKLVIVNVTRRSIFVYGMINYVKDYKTKVKQIKYQAKF
jgi:hypothetical protein